MTLISFLRLISQNLRIIVGMGILMGVITFVLTRNLKKVYSSETMINTGLVSGYTLESQERGNVDRTYTMNELDNILNTLTSRETKEATLEELIATCIYSAGKDPSVIGKAAYQNLIQLLGKKLSDSLLVKDSYESTLNRLIQVKDSDTRNPIYALIHGKHELFSLKQLSSLKANKLGLSDIIKINYQATDAGVCHQTLRLLLKSFLNRYKKLKSTDSNNVIDYFERQTQAAADRLKQAEDRLLKFGTENKIINYYEQTRFISAKKEDLEELFQQEVMKQASARASLTKLESKMDQKEKVSLTTGEIFQLRERITNLSNKIIAIELDKTRPSDDIVQLKMAYDSVEAALQSKTNTLFRMGRTVEGVQISDILKEWLNSVLILESANGRLEVLRERRDEFNRIYERFAPLGSTLKRIEREIQVCENEYLENLHSLNQAKLHWQNAQMATNLKIVDEPYYPTQPEPSKRLLLVIAAMITGSLLSLSIVLGLEFLDGTIKTPERGVMQTGLSLLGAFPSLVRVPKNVQLSYVINRTLENVSHQIRFIIQKTQPSDKSKTPSILLFISTRQGEGKTTLIRQLANKLRSEGNTVALLTPESQDKLLTDEYQYHLDNTFPTLSSFQNLVPNAHNPIEYLLVELPAILDQSYPLNAIREADLSILVAAAGRTWGKADQTALETFNACLSQSARLWVNGCKIDTLESTIGEIPKQRNKLRRWVKQLAKMQLKSHKNF